METRYGDYRVYSEEVRTNKDGRKLLHVICDCGNIDFKEWRNLLLGKTTSCKSCSAKKTAKRFPPPVNRTGCEGLSGTHFLSIKSGANKRNLVFDLTPQYLWELYQKQNGKCAITGLDIVLVNKLTKQNPDWKVISASLDRIDNNIGYVIGNVWWVHKDINRLKNNYSMSELIYWSQLIVNKHGNPDLSILNDKEVSMKEQRLGGEESTNNPPTSAQPLSEFAGQPWKEVVETIAARIYYKAFNTQGEDIV